MEDSRSRKLWCGTEAAFVRIEALSQLFVAQVKPFCPRPRAVFARGTDQIRLDGFREPVALLDNLLGLFPPNIRETGEQRTKPRAPISIVWRIISASQKRLDVRREKHAHRPTTRAGRALHKQHVNPVNIRSLFAIDLNTNKVFVQDLRNGGVFEGIVLHHMAPVAVPIFKRNKKTPSLPPPPYRSPLFPPVACTTSWFICCE